MSSSKPILQLLRTTNLDILKQLQIEEYLFHTTKSSFLFLNHGCPSQSVVMGSYNDPQSLLNIDNILQDNIRVIRRFSGGGTVLVDHNSYFMSIITNARDIGLKQFEGKYIGPREIMQWTNTFLSPVFNNLLHNMEFRILEHVDYVLCDTNATNPQNTSKKIAGNAQKISRDRFDHHTSWLWKYDIDAIDKYLRIPPKKKQPEYRNNRTHQDFLLPLNELFDNDINTLQNQLLDELHQLFDIKEVDLDYISEISGDFESLPMINDKQMTFKTQVINDELKDLVQ
eukprot:758435_1